jgi:hypothetical protein
MKKISCFTFFSLMLTSFCFSTLAHADVCSDISSAYGQCLIEAQRIYNSETSNCNSVAFGGGTIGTIGTVGGGAMLLSNPWGWAVLGVGALSGSVGIWGASGCLSSPARILSTNNLICANNQTNTKKACDDAKKEQSGRSGANASGDSPNSGSGGRTVAGNAGGANNGWGGGSYKGTRGVVLLE